MKNKVEIIREDKEAEVLVITPLLPGHKVSKETKKTINRNNTKLVWIKSIGDNNIPTNVENGLLWFKNNKSHLPQYCLPLDNDIILGRYMIDRLVGKMSIMPDFVAYSFASFRFKGVMNHSFPAVKFDVGKLLKDNYISSNSLFRTEVLLKIPSVKDEKYRRLLDWVYFIKLLDRGYIGVPCKEANFVALSTPEDISSGSTKDWKLKKKRVFHDFIKPFAEGIEDNESFKRMESYIYTS